MAGWVKMHRSLVEWEWYDDHNTTRLFIHLILKVNHKDGRWKGNKVYRGQTITSLETLASETGLSISQIRTSLKKLISTGEIASLSQARNRVITVIGYDSYQADSKVDDKLIASSSQDDSNKQECKTGENDKNYILPTDVDQCPHQEIIAMYHERLPSLAHVRAWTDQRAKLLRSRWREDPERQNLEWWGRLFEYIGQSDFLMGRIEQHNRKPFEASLEWILKPANFVKIIEGQYAN